MTRSLHVTRHTLDDRAAETIREEILSGRFVPGERLTEVGLSEQLKLSRGTVRSALQQLQHDGLVVLFPYRGWAVQSLSAQDAWEVYTLRNALESMAARLLAATIDAAKAEVIKQRYADLRRAVERGSRPDTIATDFAFHRAVMTLCGHQRLQAHYKTIEQQTQLFFAFGSAFLRLADYIRYHEPMVEAILAGNPEEAARLAAEHNTDDGEALVARLKAMEAAGDMARAGQR